MKNKLVVCSVNHKAFLIREIAAPLEGHWMTVTTLFKKETISRSPTNHGKGKTEGHLFPHIENLILHHDCASLKFYSKVQQFSIQD